MGSTFAVFSLLCAHTPPASRRDGEHLLGYAHDGGKYTLHVWRLRPSKPACLLCSTTLFATRTSSVAEFLTPDDERALPLLVTMCELAEGDTLGALVFAHLSLCVCQLENHAASLVQSSTGRSMKRGSQCHRVVRTLPPCSTRLLIQPCRSKRSAVPL